MGEIINSQVFSTFGVTGDKLEYKNSPHAPNGYELGTGITFGTLITPVYELNLSTGYIKCTVPHNFVAGVADLHSTAEQIPVLRITATTCR